jgi:thioredoxin-like negative regulator of GroEL
VGDANFDQEVVQSKLPVVCLVSSEAAARAVVPLILQASAQHTDIKFVFLNSDNDMALAQELGVTKVPTMLPIFQGKLLEAPMVGAPTPQQAADFFRRVSEMGRTMGTMAQTAAAMNDLIAQGEGFLTEGALDKAAQCFEQAVQAGGPNPAAFAGLALIALQAGEVETCESNSRPCRISKITRRFRCASAR